MALRRLLLEPANASRAAAASEPVVRPARVDGNRLPAAQPVARAGRHRRAAHRDAPWASASPARSSRATVDVGTIVKPGDLIAQLDPADYRLAVDNARAALASADADYARAKADLERYQMLRGSAPSCPDARRSASRSPRPRSPSVEQARSQLSSAENNLAYTELHADAAGVITAVQAEVGQVLAQGQGMVKLARTDELEILVGVPEHRLKTVREAEPPASNCGPTPAIATPPSCASCRPAPTR